MSLLGIPDLRRSAVGPDHRWHLRSPHWPEAADPRGEGPGAPAGGEPADLLALSLPVGEELVDLAQGSKQLKIDQDARGATPRILRRSGSSTASRAPSLMTPFMPSFELRRLSIMRPRPGASYGLEMGAYVPIPVVASVTFPSWRTELAALSSRGRQYGGSPTAMTCPKCRTTDAPLLVLRGSGTDSRGVSLQTPLLRPPVDNCAKRQT